MLTKTETMRRIEVLFENAGKRQPWLFRAPIITNPIAPSPKPANRYKTDAMRKSEARYRYAPEVKEAARRLMIAGMRDVEICRELLLNAPRVHKWRKEFGISRKEALASVHSFPSIET